MKSVKSIDRLKFLPGGRAGLKILLITFVCICSGSQQIWAQNIEPEYFSISEGVASPTVNDVIQDSYGILWIGTSNGLQRYDGYNFQTFKNVPGVSSSIQHNFIWGLLEDENHDIWVSNTLGVSKYIRESNEFKNYDFTTIFNFSSTSQVQGFRFFIDSQQRLWAPTITVQLVQYDSINDTWRYANYEVPDVPEPVHTGFATCAVEDQKGGIWTGSQIYGLMHLAKGDSAFRPMSADRFRGLDFTGQNAITGLFADSTNTLWITTKNGVYKYHTESGEFKTFKEYHAESPNDIWNNWNSIIQDHEGNVWIANNYRGILKFEGISDQFEEITIEGVIRTKTRGWNLTLTNMMVDRSGIFWMGSRESGLLKYDPVSKSFSFFAHDDTDPGGLSSGGVFGLLASKVNPGKIYVGMRGEGLNIYDPALRTFEKVKFLSVDDWYGGSVRSIAEKENGSLYIGTWGDGMISLDQNYQEIKRYKYNPESPHSISENRVRVIKQDNEGRFWVGTNNGLNIFDPEKEEFRLLASVGTKAYADELTSEVERLIGTDQVIGMIDSVGDYQNLSVTLEIESTGTYFVVSVGEGDSDGLFDFGWLMNASKDTIWDFTDYEASYHAGGAVKNRIIIEPIVLQPGTYTLHYQSDDSHSFDKWNANQPTLSSLYGIALIQPADGNQSRDIVNLLGKIDDKFILTGTNITDIEIDGQFVWVSAGGLNKVDPETNTVTYYLNEPDNINTPASNNILDIHRDKHGMIWLATNAGIDKINPATGKFTHYSEKDGLPTNLTQAVLEGDNGEMWFATQNGLSQMITNEALGKVTFINYNSTDGLGGEAFLYGAADRSPDGRFYFGGEHGLTTFSEVESNNTPPALIFSNLLISNQSVLAMGKDSPLDKNLQETTSITLSHDQNNLSFEFAALHYANPQKNQYAHILKGYDREWTYDNRNFAMYTNLDPGKYEFSIRASNAYGIWNEEGKSIEIIIHPPWWRTTLAYIAYAVILGFLVFGFDRLMRRNIKRKERERMREKELAHAKEIEKAYHDLKTTQDQLIHSEKMASLGELTAGIAHEIQNPLNFVNNFSDVNGELIEEMLDEIKAGNFQEVERIAKDIKENEEKVKHHGHRADAIVKSMLMHSRAASGERQSTDINILADEYLRLAFHGMRAKDKSFNASVKTDFDETLEKIEIVPQDIGRVILNLITNAFHAVSEKKARSENGYAPEVLVSTRKSANKLYIAVRDNGTGIPENIKDKIFQPFYTTKPSGQGTGLGLSLSYDIVKVHNGELRVETKEGEGTEFVLELPLV